MKHLCPHCKEASISHWAKFNSNGLQPIICPNCKNQSKQNYFGGLIGGIVYFGGSAISVWSFVLESWLPIVIFLFVSFCLGIAQFLYVPLVKVNQESVKNKQWFILGSLVVLLIWSITEALK